MWPPKSWYCYKGIYFPIEIWDPDYYRELHPDLVLFWAQNAPLGPQTGSGAVPELPQLRDTPRHSGAGPETPCFVSRLPSNASKALAILLGFWKLRNFLRPINASMKEATAKRHLAVWIGLRLVLCPVPPPTSQSFVLGHGTCAGQRRL